MRGAKRVTVIPPKHSIHMNAPVNSILKKRVAAYARVSTDSEEQQTSYEAQVNYYTDFIKSKPEWLYIDTYTDEGISAVSTKNREGFNRMIKDALNGKIDLIITKSVSRFARNTVDSLTTVRKLKEKGVEVWFEKENIFTLDSKGELLITIMSSLAQEESRSISENVTWGQRKRFADGKVSLPYSRFLGYDRGEDGLPQINQEEAVTVRRIYRLFLEGKTPHGIAKILTADEILTPGGKEKWQAGTISSILSNEKYMGHALLQKKYTVNFLTKKQKLNEGEVPQYYVENSHPAIVSPEVFEMVQQEIRRRKQSPVRHSGNGIFSSRIVCGECGTNYGSKVWHSNSKYRRVIYQCNNKFKEKCSTPHFYEEEIKEMFISALNKLVTCRAEIIDNFETAKNIIFATKDLDIEISNLQNEMTVVTDMIRNIVDENASKAISQEDYNKRYADLAERYEKAKERFARVSNLRRDKKTRKKAIKSFIEELKQQDSLITEFDERLWHTLLDSITVKSEKSIDFIFKNGTTISP